MYRILMKIKSLNQNLLELRDLIIVAQHYLLLKFFKKVVKILKRFVQNKKIH